MATLRQKIESLTPERRAIVSQRAEELIAEEISLRMSSNHTGASPDASAVQPKQDEESATRKSA